MFFNNQYKKLDKEILKDAKYYLENYDDIAIDVKVDNNNQLFSSYNYDNKTNLNKDLCDYLWENTKLAPNKNITINIYDKSAVSDTKIESAIQSHYRREYKHAKAELQNINFFTLSCFIFGMISLILLVFLHDLVNNYYVDVILEIIAWVFIWEAADKFFLERPSLKRKCIQIQKLYSANVIVKK